MQETDEIKEKRGKLEEHRDKIYDNEERKKGKIGEDGRG